MSHDPIDDAFQKRHALNIALSSEYIAELESAVAALRQQVEGMREELLAQQRILAKLPDTIRGSTWKTPELRKSAAALVTIITNTLTEDENAARKESSK